MFKNKKIFISLSIIIILIIFISLTLFINNKKPNLFKIPTEAKNALELNDFYLYFNFNKTDIRNAIITLEQYEGGSLKYTSPILDTKISGDETLLLTINKLDGIASFKTLVVSEKSGIFGKQSLDFEFKFANYPAEAHWTITGDENEKKINNSLIEGNECIVSYIGMNKGYKIRDLGADYQNPDKISKNFDYVYVLKLKTIT